MISTFPSLGRARISPFAGLGLGLLFGEPSTSPEVPSTALAYSGEPLAFNGEYITFTP